MLEDTADPLELKWHRCQREARSLVLLELAQTALSVGILIIVALCGIVAITDTAVRAGAVALPLGLGLAVTISLTLLGLAFRTRMSLERSTRELFKLECALRTAAELRKVDAHPYRERAPSAGPLCTVCLFDVQSN
ncbi:MAG: hypothetical protein JWO86_36 [Myxococcaceae bacterium]|nr:hypothetical protein [Myxococcaceae bacterium]